MCACTDTVVYSTNCSGVKLWQINRFRVLVWNIFNVGKFIRLTFSYLYEYGIWLGKILANEICFAKVFPHQNIVL